MKNNKGAMSGGMILMIAAILIGAYMFVPAVQDTVDGIFAPSVTSDDDAQGTCSSSGLTEITLNTQEALAATATNAVTDYYVFDKDGTFVKTGNSGTNGQSVFDVDCGPGMKYDVLVINETAETGSYGQNIEIDAVKATKTYNLKMYEYGEINLVSVASSTDPIGSSNISAGLGKTCGFTITFNVNESASLRKQQKNCSIILIYFFVPHALPMHLLIQAELLEQHYTDFLIKKWRWMTSQIQGLPSVNH